MPNYTSNYSFNLSIVNSATDENLWGTQNNFNWSSIDSLLNTRTQAQDFANFALKNPNLTSTGEEAQSASSSSGVLTVDLDSGNHIETTLTENITNIVVQNPKSSGVLSYVTFKFTQNGASSYTITYPSSFKWKDGSAHVMTTTLSAVDIVGAFTYDGGTTWYAFITGQNFS